VTFGHSFFCPLYRTLQMKLLATALSVWYLYWQHRRRPQRNIHSDSRMQSRATESQRRCSADVSLCANNINFVCRHTHHCLQEKTPRYLVDCCTPVSEVAGCQLLRSASRHHVTVPRYQLNTFWRLLAFSVAGPTSWNSLADRLRDPTLSSDNTSATPHLCTELSNAAATTEELQSILFEKFAEFSHHSARLTNSDWWCKKFPNPSNL